MTDSENEITNILSFPNMSTTVSARGPNTNITNLSFRNQMTSTMYMPRNFERQRYAESVSDQRSMYYRRETSPMSIHSACDMRPRNFQSYYQGGSQRSMINGRSGSPMSMRSMDSTASVSAADIAFAFKNVKFNKHDLQLIKDAYHKLMKQRIRKRIEKRRNHRLFLKGNRRRSAYDSGDQGSDSSLSSDDGRSNKTSYKENMSSCRSTNIDLADLRRTVNDSSILKNCTDNIKQSTFRNMFSVGSASGGRQNVSNKSINHSHSSAFIQKDRFKNSFLLPSQRFNKSVAGSVIPENIEKPCKNFKNVSMQNIRNHCSQNERAKNNIDGSNSEATDEEIFSANSANDRKISHQANQSKRSLECDEDNLPNNKKTKLSSPVKNATKQKLPTKSKNSNPIQNIKDKNGNNFEFAVPTLPVKKGKLKIQEKLIAKSAPALDLMELGAEKPVVETDSFNIQEKSVTGQSQPDPDGTDVSMRPSFIKRKLFTQKLDVTEKANLSTDSLNSPRNTYKSVSKEKNKTRKLVTSQSCLNREVEDDSNLLDLIHKIVPPDRMNVTNHTTIIQNAKKGVDNKSKKYDDGWDVTSVLSTVNDDDVSDTYTDEEIFNNDNKTRKNTEQNKKEQANTLHENTKRVNISGTFTDEEIFVSDNTKRCNMKKDRKVQEQIDPKSGNKDKNVDVIKSNKVKPLPSQDSRALIEKKIPPQENNPEKIQKQTSNIGQPLSQKKVIKQNGISKPKLLNGPKSFWDTDFESDIECVTPLHRRIHRTAVIHSDDISKNKDITIQEEDPQHIRNQGSSDVAPNRTVINHTIDTVKKFNLNMSNISIRSHRTTKAKKCCSEDVTKDNKLKFKPQIKSSTHTEKPISLQNKSHNIVTNSRPNTRLNSSRDYQSTVTVAENNKKNRSVSVTKKKDFDNNKTKSKAVDKTETPKTKNKSETRIKNTKPRVKAQEINMSVSNDLVSRPNTRLNASKENALNNTKTNVIAKSATNTKTSPNKKPKTTTAKESKTKLQSDKANKSLKNISNKAVALVKKKPNTKLNAQHKISRYDIKSPLTRTPRRNATPRRR